MAAMHSDPFLNPKAIAETGEKIYREKYQKDFEAKHLGKFVAVDVGTEDTYLGETSEEALSAARHASPKGVFHLVRVGAPGAFRVSFSSNASVDWFFQ